jgi:CII-binding regulator of phage lambda lysogenization HflD
MFKSLIDNFVPALFGNSEAKKLLQTLLLVQKELNKAEQRTIYVEARLDELHEQLKVSTQQNEQLLLEENQQLKNTAEELRQEIEASRGKIVRLEEEFKVELQKNHTELENVRFKNEIAIFFAH